MSPECFAVVYPDQELRTTGMGLEAGDSFSFLSTRKITAQHNVKSECACSEGRLFRSFRQWSDGYILFTKIKTSSAYGHMNTLMQDGHVRKHRVVTKNLDSPNSVKQQLGSTWDILLSSGAKVSVPPSCCFPDICTCASLLTI